MVPRNEKSSRGGPPIARKYPLFVVVARPSHHNEHVSNLWCTVVVPRGSAHSHSRARPWFMPLVKQPLSRHQAPWKNYFAFPPRQLHLRARADSFMTQFSKPWSIRESSKITFFPFFFLILIRSFDSWWKGRQVSLVNSKDSSRCFEEIFYLVLSVGRINGYRTGEIPYSYSFSIIHIDYSLIVRKYFLESFIFVLAQSVYMHAHTYSLSIRFHFIDRSIDAGSKLALKRRGERPVRRIVMGTWASSHGEMHFRLAPEATLSRDPDEGRGRTTTKAAS